MKLTATTVSNFIVRLWSDQLDYETAALVDWLTVELMIIFCSIIFIIIIISIRYLIEKKERLTVLLNVVCRHVGSFWSERIESIAFE